MKREDMTKKELREELDKADEDLTVLRAEKERQARKFGEDLASLRADHDKQIAMAKDSRREAEAAEERERLLYEFIDKILVSNYNLIQYAAQVIHWNPAVEVTYEDHRGVIQDATNNHDDAKAIVERNRPVRSEQEFVSMSNPGAKREFMKFMETLGNAAHEE